MTGRDDGAPSGVAVTEEVRPEVATRECRSCLRPRMSVRGYRLPDGTTWEICSLCAKAVGGTLAAPECSEPALVDICATRVEALTAAADRQERAVVCDPPYSTQLPYVWPDPTEPEICS